MKNEFIVSRMFDKGQKVELVQEINIAKSSIDKAVKSFSKGTKGTIIGWDESSHYPVAYSVSIGDIVVHSVLEYMITFC